MLEIHNLWRPANWFWNLDPPQVPQPRRTKTLRQDVTKLAKNFYGPGGSKQYATTLSVATKKFLDVTSQVDTS
jgi:hypothetical protein